MIQKLNDYFLNLLNNPTFNADDFTLVGLSVDNTSILDKNIYFNSNYIRNLDVFKTNGIFDESKFNNFYDYAKLGFADLAKIKEIDDLGRTWKAYRNDISMPENLRDNSPQFKILKVTNPLRQQEGFTTFGLKENPTLSIREIALSLKVWNTETNSWEESPNETWFDNFINPKVLATWDEDGIHQDPISGEMTQHRKGERKLNSNGTYYYETLGNRSVYGKEVLSGFDTLTTDGSTWNKLDFLDSDDIEKSTGGAMMKAAAQILPAFIPGVGEWYIGARVGLGMSLIIPAVGKAFESLAGIDVSNSLFNKLEAWDKALSFSLSDYTQGSLTDDGKVLSDSHLWSAETGLKLIADVFTQLAEQRWMFEKSASLFSGLSKDVITSKKALSEWIEDYITKNSNRANNLDDILEGLSKGVPAELTNATKSAINWSKALKILLDKLNGANELGRKLSMAYMTGITTASSFGEAKQAGASDLEAALFTLGYTFGEWKLLNSELGRWILPELKSEERHIKNVINKAMPLVKEVTAKSNTGTEIGKLKWYLKLFDLGKKAYNNNLGEGIGSEAVGATISNMTSEALEETSEELLLDFSKVLFNAGTSLVGSDAKFEDAFKNVFDRYALSFLGGAIGGGIAGALPAYRSARFDRSITQQAATKELVDFVQLGKDKELLNTAYKMTFGNKYLDENGNQVENENQSLDYMIKQNFTRLVQDIKDILDVNGANLDKDSLIKRLGTSDVIKDIRYGMLANLATLESNSIGWYLNRYNELSSLLVEKSLELKSLEKNKSDKLEREETLTPERESLLKEEIKEIKEELDKFKDGTMSDEFILDALFEMTSKISGEYIPTDPDRWIEEQTGKSIKELTPKELLKWKDEFENTRPIRRDLTRLARQVHIKNMENLSKIITDYNKEYFEDDKSAMANLDEILFGHRRDVLSNSEESFTKLEDYLANRSDRINPLLYNFLQIILSKMEESKAKPFLERIRAIEKLPITFTSHLGIDSLPTTVEELRSLDDETKRKIFGNLGRSTSDLEASTESFIETSEDGTEVLNSDFSKEINLFNKELREELTTQFASQLRGFINNKEVKKEIIKRISEAKYILPTVKQALTDFFTSLVTMTEYMEDPQVENLVVNLDDLQDYLNSFKDKPSSPVDIYLNKVVTTLRSQGMDISPVVANMEELVSKLAKAKNLESFSYDEQLEKVIDDALNIIKLAKVGLDSAATTINGDLSDAFGYNVSVNEIRAKREEKTQELATISADIAEGIKMDILKYEQELLLFKQLLAINSNAALNEHDETYKVQSINLYNRIKDFVGHLEAGDWDEVDKLKSAVEKSELLKLKEDDKINLEYKENLTKERLFLDKAIHNFFKANSDKLRNFKTKEDRDKAISLVKQLIKDFKILYLFDKDTTTLLNSLEKTLGDKDLLWYLASLAAADPEAVMNEYSQVISALFAPIIGLEEAIKTALSFLIDPKIFKLFADAYNETIFENFSEEELRKRGGYSYINAYRSIFIEGLPGSGKSTAVLKTLTDILNKFHSEILEKAIIISNSERNALRLKDDLLLDKAKHFGIEEFRKKVLNNYIPFNVNSEGIMEVKEGEDIHQSEEDDNPIWKYKKATINSDAIDASLIIVDEATSLSQMDAAMFDELMETKNIYGIYAGDFDLIGASGITDKKNLITLDATNYISTHKLGLVIRGNNVYKSNNVLGFRLNKYDFIRSLLKNGRINPITFTYYKDDTGVYGDIVTKANKITTGSGITYDLDSNTKEIIKKMVDTLLEGEKINFIFDDLTSEMYKYLHDNYADKINEVSTKAAQSQEGQYYIVDVQLKNNIDGQDAGWINATNLFKTLYTAMSRAKLATLIYERKENNVISPRLNSIAANKLVKSSIGQEARRKYAESRKLAIEKALNGNNSTLSKDWKNLVFEEKKNPIENDDEKEQENEEETFDDKTNTRNLPKEININNSSEDSLNMMIHSFNTHECGGIINDKGELELSERHGERIDNAHGIIKALKINPDSEGKLSKADTDRVLKILHKCRTAGLYEKSNNDIVSKVKSAFRLGSKDNVTVNFIYRNSQKEFEEGKGRGALSKFFRGVKDKLLYLFNKNTNLKLETPPNRVFALEIFINGLQVEIPIGILTNPATLLETKGFEKLKDLYTNCGSNLIKFHEELLKRKNEGLPHTNSMLKLLEVYLWNYTHTTDNQNFVVRFNKDFVLHSNNSKLTGVLTPPKKRGEGYLDKDYFYEGKRLNLNDYRKLMPNRKISDIYENLKEDIKDADGNIALEHGIPFILVSDYYNEDSDRQLYEKYIKQIQDKNAEPLITRVYVYLPTESINYFLYNLQEALKGNEEESADNIDRTIGNMLTSYRLLQFMLLDDSEYSKAFENWITSNLDSQEQKELARKRFNRMKEIIKYLSDYEKTLVPSSSKGSLSKQMLKFLNLNLENIRGNGSLFKLFYPTSDGALIGNTKWTLRTILQYEFRKLLFSEGLYETLNSEGQYVSKSLSGLNYAIEKNGDNYIYKNYLIERIEALKKDAEHNGWNGIMFHSSLQRDSEISSQGFTIGRINTQEASYISSRDIELNGKLDSTAIIANVEPVLDEILSKLITSGNKSCSEMLKGKSDSARQRIYDENTGAYMKGEDTSMIESPENKLLNEVLNSLASSSNTKENIQIIKDFIKNNGTNYQIPGILNLAFDLKKYAIIVDSSEKYHIKEINSDRIIADTPTLEKVYYAKIENNILTIYKVTATEQLSATIEELLDLLTNPNFRILRETLTIKDYIAAHLQGDVAGTHNLLLVMDLFGPNIDYKDILNLSEEDLRNSGILTGDGIINKKAYNIPKLLGIYILTLLDRPEEDFEILESIQNIEELAKLLGVEDKAKLDELLKALQKSIEGLTFNTANCILFDK